MIILLSLTGLLSFITFLYVEYVLIGRISKTYPDLYDRLDRPWYFWAGPRNFYFIFSFILARNFTKEDLDRNTIQWCNIASVSLTLFYLVVLVGVLLSVLF